MLPKGVQPVIGMSVRTGGPKKLHRRTKGKKPKGFELDGKERVVEKFLPPINTPLPPSLYAVGLNYKKHAIEVGKEMPRNPLTFLLATTSLSGHDQVVRVPKEAQNPMEVDFEVELGIVISRACKNVSVEDAMSYVLGFTVANDVSARRWQGKKGGGQWSRSKSFDTFTPLGPCLLVPDDCDSLDASALHFDVKTRVNDVEYQNSNTKDMIFNPAEIVSFISQGTTLEKGTVIITGTPEGVGYTRDPPMFLKDGDVVEVGALILFDVIIFHPSRCWMRLMTGREKLLFLFFSSSHSLFLLSVSSNTV